MSLKDMFSKKGSDAKQRYTEADNVGTRQDTFSKAQAYWLYERPGLSKRPPFTLFYMPSAAAAEAALLELPFIHKAADSGKLICDRIMVFGFYAVGQGTQGECEAIVCGNDFTRDEFRRAEAAFTEHGGKRKSADEPDASVKAPTGTGNAKRVKYKEKTRSGAAIYEVYVGPTKADAIAFLKAKRVTEKQYYICVDTPEGSFGKDINGIYQE